MGQKEWTVGSCVACNDIGHQEAPRVGTLAYLWVHNDFHVNSILFLQSFNCCKRDPEVVCVEYFEF